MLEVYTNIKNARKLRGWSQSEFALVEEYRESDERGRALAHETLKICKSKK